MTANDIIRERIADDLEAAEKPVGMGLTSQNGVAAKIKQGDAIVALLTCGTIEAAAKQCGVNPGTYFRWLKQPEFVEALEDARRQVMNLAIQNMSNAATKAIATLEGVMNNSKATDRDKITAASTVLDFMLRTREVSNSKHATRNTNGK